MKEKKNNFDSELEELWKEGVKPEEYEILSAAIKTAEDSFVPEGLGRKLRAIASSSAEKKTSIFFPAGSVVAGALVMGFALFFVIRPLEDGFEGGDLNPSPQVEEDSLEWTAEDLFLGSDSPSLFLMEDVL